MGTTETKYSRGERRTHLSRLFDEVRINPYPSGGLDQSAIVTIADYLHGGNVKIFHALGAVRRSGSNATQLHELLRQIEAEFAEGKEVEEAVSSAMQSLGVTAMEASIVSEHPAVEAPSARSQTDVSTAAAKVETNAGRTPNQDEVKTPQNGPIAKLLMLAVGSMALAVFFGFFFLWANEGWGAANRKNPAGGALFLIAAFIAYVVAIPILKSNGYRTLATIMTWIALAAGAVLVTSLFPSCTTSDSSYQVDHPYRK